MAPLVSKDPVNEGLGIWGIGVEIQVKGWWMSRIWDVMFRYLGAMFGGSLE